MGTLALTAIWLALHVCGYFVVLRASPRLNSEKVIVAYHLSSWCVLGAWLTMSGLMGDAPGLTVPMVAALGLHGMYSMTFWEIWGSSEGGFSLRIMDQIDQGRQRRAELLEYFERLGQEKRTSRLDDLKRFGLVRKRGQRYAVGVIGVLIVTIIRLLHLIGNVKKAG